MSSRKNGYGNRHIRFLFYRTVAPLGISPSTNKTRTSFSAASAATARLNRHPEVSARIARLREDAIARMGVDRLYILAKRKYIAEHARSMDARLRALSDLETSLGLDTPQRIDISHTGQIGIELP